MTYELRGGTPAAAMSQTVRRPRAVKRLTETQREDYINAVESLIKEISFFANQLVSDVDPLMDFFQELMKR